jgi:hypothetical protein
MYCWVSGGYVLDVLPWFKVSPAAAAAQNTRLSAYST